MVPPMSIIPKDYDKPEHFVHITLNADGNAKSDSENVKVEG